MCSDLGEGSRCCALYSFTGIIFTLWVGVMVHSQSFFISGIDDAEKATSSAFGAMGMFLATFLASLAGIWYDSNNKGASAVDGSESESGYHLSTDNNTSYGSTN